MTLYTPESPDNKSIRETTDTLKRFAQATQDFNRQTSRQTAQMVRLTWAMLILTAVMVFGLGVQIYLAWPNSAPYAEASAGLAGGR